MLDALVDFERTALGVSDPPLAKHRSYLLAATVAEIGDELEKTHRTLGYR